MRAYAKKFALPEEEAEKFGITGLLHDFDYEKYPTPEEHPFVGNKIMRERGYPEDILRANLPYFRQILLDGILVKERYLDRAALEMTLSGQILKGTASVGEILDHVLVEAWLRSWMEQRSRLAA